VAATEADGAKMYVPVVVADEEEAAKGVEEERKNRRKREIPKFKSLTRLTSDDQHLNRSHMTILQ
jgi:hypothetical protein